MRTTITRRGQTVIPAKLRGRYNLVDGSQVEWVDTGAGLKVIPVPTDPIAALRGSGRGEGLTKRLIAERARDRDRE
jgi:AbrB family looped-hinge helix DNA binding protein